MGNWREHRYDLIDVGLTPCKVPSPSGPAMPSQDTSTKTSPAVILAAFRGQIKPVRSSPIYLLGLLLVAVVMVILPLVYLALIGLIIYAVCYHAIHDVGMLSAARGGRGLVLVFLVYAAPMVIGPIVIAFMFRPLFSRAGRRGKPVSLDPDAQSFLFAFVERVCDAVGAPQPRRIDVDCEVNASAGFRRGVWSMLGRDMVLTIGLPLVAGLNLQELAGILAHEFGHFSQSAGMRLTYIIRSINNWFMRVVYERDEWDAKLAHASRETDFRIGWILLLARFFVWLTRKVLWVLMMLGHLVGGFMLRQMEFDADTHEIRLTGSKNFEETMGQVNLLSFAARGAEADMGEFYREGRLADDLPRLIMANVQQFSSETRSTLDELMQQSRTGWLDSHPCARERVAHARRQNADGIFHVQEPATSLFQDFSRISRKATWQFYRYIFGKGLKRQTIQPIEHLLARQNEEMEAFQALERYFEGTFQPWRSLPFPAEAPSASADPKQTAVQLRASCREMMESVTPYKAICAEYEKIGRKERDAVHARMESFERSAAHRLFAALELLQVRGSEKRIPDAAAWRQETAKLLPALRTLNEQLEAVSRGRHMQEALGELFSRFMANQDDEELVRRLRKKTQEAERHVSQLRLLLAADYPFDHAHGRFSIGAYALPDSPDAENPVEVYQALGTLAD